jgi:hypothetical protein
MGSRVLVLAIKRVGKAATARVHLREKISGLDD